MWESFGEDAYLSAEMARQMVLGYQGDDPNHIDACHIASCPKHFMAYGMTNSGQDRTPAYVSLSELREKHFAPFKAAIEAGALSVMVNSASINGIPTHADKELLTGWLKEGLGWDGVIVTDWADIVNLYSREKIAVDYKDAIRLAINAGIDMSMIPYDVNFCPLLVELVEEGQGVAAARRRCRGARHTYETASGADRQTQYLRRGLSRVSGRGDSPRMLRCRLRVDHAVEERGCRAAAPQRAPRCSWRVPMPIVCVLCAAVGATLGRGDIVDKVLPDGVTILDAMRAVGGDDIVYAAGVEYKEGGRYYDETNIDIEAAVRAAADVDCIVLCLGENSYCETPGNLTDMAISPNQQALAEALAATGKPVVLVLSEGRARIISSFADRMKAVLHTYICPVRRVLRP